MEPQEVFKDMGMAMSAGNMDELRDLAKGLEESTDDPFVLLQCVSLLKVVRMDDLMFEIVSKIMRNLGDDMRTRVEIAGALRGLEYPVQAYEIVKTLEVSDSTRRLSMMCLVDMEEYESALEVAESIEDPKPIDRITLSNIRSALGEHAEAIAIAEALDRDLPGDYDVMVCNVDALMIAGREKDAVKYARQCLKSKDADGNAVAAYAMRIMGNDKSAAGFATRAIKLDPKHVGAMETLGICLANKGEYEKARIVAGAINEASPGNRAAMEVLRYCDRIGPRASASRSTWSSSWRGG